jgi:hypothetical protein
MAMDLLKQDGRVLRNAITGLQRGAGDIRENVKIWQRLILSWCRDPGGLIVSIAELYWDESLRIKFCRDS